MTCEFMSFSTVFQPYKNYEMLCVMEPVIIEIQSTVLKPGTASPAGQLLTLMHSEFRSATGLSYYTELPGLTSTEKILKFGTPQTIAIIVLKIEKFDVTLH